ncbi:MAG: 4Fe-4S binding protein [Myxococcota bacterium]|nr:4Fe-4S binding protein [Myxococcota bacterium]
MRRKIIEIDAAKCDGCGLCVQACHEGAIGLVDGKAVLLSDSYCDGLGDCLAECPQDAIRIIEREADDFDEQAVAARLHGGTQNPGSPVCDTVLSRSLLPSMPNNLGEQAKRPMDKRPGGHLGCPGRAARQLTPLPMSATPAATQQRPSALQHWPVQLHLLPLQAPWLNRARLLLAADCVPFAFPAFHEKLLAGRVLAVGCPKLDDAAFYQEKLSKILQSNDIEGLDVAYMEVPCCRGLLRLAVEAVRASAKPIPIRRILIGVRGELSRLDEPERA